MKPPLSPDVIKLIIDQAMLTPPGRRPQGVIRALVRLVEAEHGLEPTLSDPMIDDLVTRAVRSGASNRTLTGILVRFVEAELYRIAFRESLRPRRNDLELA